MIGQPTYVKFDILEEMMKNKKHETLTRVKNGKYKTKFLPVLGLLLFAPFTAEYMIGYLDVTGSFDLMFLYLIFFGPLYGGAALIIREVTRRAGLGWPTMIILAFAFSLFQAGLVDHGLFNPSFQDIDYWQDLRDPTYIPLFGISAYQAVEFISGHVIWSIAVPIVFIEIFFSKQKKEPWLSNFNFVIIFILYLLASAFIFQDQVTMDQFLPSLTQFIFTGIIVIVLIFAAFVVGRRHRHSSRKVAPNPWLVGAITLLILSMHTIIELLGALFGFPADFMMAWPGVILRFILLLLLGYLVLHWSKRKFWGAMHHLALAGGAILTRTWVAFLIEPLGDVSFNDKLIGNTIFLAGAFVLIFLCAYLIRKKDFQRT